MMKIVANIVSIILHPLLMGTYGVWLALSCTYLSIYPMLVKLSLGGGVFLCTAVIPGILILLMVKSGAAGDLELTDRKERVIPYLVFITSNIVCLFYLFKMQMPFWLLSMFVGGCFGLFLSLCINFAWKISAHAMGIGGLLGAIMGVARIQMVNPYWLFMIVVVGCGLLATSRIILQKHTPMQVYAGFSVGFLCTFGASSINMIHLL